LLKFMNQEEIRRFLSSFEGKRDRTIVIVDFGNVEKWKVNLGWKVGIRELSCLIRNFSSGENSRNRRRFYYGSDYGKDERNNQLTEWSRSKLEMAKWNKFEIVTKRVKYMKNRDNLNGFDKKCDLDVEMAVDLIKLRNEFDHIVLFSGDGDLVYAIKYLRENFGKSCIVFGARQHIGREIFDAKSKGVIDNVYFVEDFEYRLRDRYGR